MDADDVAWTMIFLGEADGAAEQWHVVYEHLFVYIIPMHLQQLMLIRYT